MYALRNLVQSVQFEKSDNIRGGLLILVLL